jgi:hypothetical protein
MRFSLADVWCDPKTGTCQVAPPPELAKYSDFAENVSAGRIHAARCEAEGQVVFVVVDSGSDFDASARARVIDGLLRLEKSLVALITKSETACCAVTLVPRRNRVDRELAAQAAATVQASWGWDASWEIAVTVEGEVIEVAPCDRAAGWWGAVEIRR